MTKTRIIGAALAAAALLLVLGVVIRQLALTQEAAPDATASPAVTEPVATGVASTSDADSGFLYGRITDTDGARFEGRLRWGRDQEAFWSDYFNGTKSRNPWEGHIPRAPSAFEIFGVEIGGREGPDLGRLFMARFGELARIEARVRTVLVTLKSGTVVELDRFSAGDIDDGVRVWDTGGVVDLDARRIRTIDFIPTAPLAAAPGRLHGTVRTRFGDFTGFIQWDAGDSVSTDTLDGRAGDRDLHQRYDTIRSIARDSRDRARVTLADGREVVLSGAEVGDHNRGISVDDARYGRVQISWDVFERADFTSAGSGPAYADFPRGRALAGRVTTRDGRRLAGRLVYDVDESETTETLDAALPGVDFNIPFSLIASIVPGGREGRATVTLHDGEELQLERTGDLGERNAGVLIFTEGRERPEYVRWADVERIDFDRAK